MFLRDVSFLPSFLLFLKIVFKKYSDTQILLFDLMEIVLIYLSYYLKGHTTQWDEKTSSVFIPPLVVDTRVSGSFLEHIFFFALATVQRKEI